MDLSRELDYSEYRTKQNEAVQDTARSRIRLYRILQESKRGCAGYCKIRNEATQNTSRSRISLCRIPQEAEGGCEEYRKKQATKKNKKIRLRRRGAKTNKSAYAGY